MKRATPSREGGRSAPDSNYEAIRHRADELARTCDIIKLFPCLRARQEDKSLPGCPQCKQGELMLHRVAGDRDRLKCNVCKKGLDCIDLVRVESNVRVADAVSRIEKFHFRGCVKTGEGIVLPATASGQSAMIGRTSGERNDIPIMKDLI